MILIFSTIFLKSAAKNEIISGKKGIWAAKNEQKNVSILSLSTDFNTSQLVLEFQLNGTVVYIEWYWWLY